MGKDQNIQQRIPEMGKPPTRMRAGSWEPPNVAMTLQTYSATTAESLSVSSERIFGANAEDPAFSALFIVIKCYYDTTWVCLLF